MLSIKIYSMVSTIEQAEEGYSINEQERLLIEWCRKMDYEVYRCYADRRIREKNNSTECRNGYVCKG